MIGEFWGKVLRIKTLDNFGSISHKTLLGKKEMFNPENFAH